MSSTESNLLKRLILLEIFNEIIVIPRNFIGVFNSWLF